jgi:hypothetical protein
MKTLIAILLAASPLIGGDTIAAFDHQWMVPVGSDWKVTGEGGDQILELLTPRGPLPGPRRPIQFAVAQTPDFGNVNVELDMRPRSRSLVIVFSYRDAAHFDYAHLSIDTGLKQPVHNGIFHVFGGERVRISSQAGPPAFPETNHWYHVVLKHEEKSSSVQVAVDGRDIPALRGVDLSLTSGKIGLGSFDEVGDFKNVKITGEASTGQ